MTPPHENIETRAKALLLKAGLKATKIRVAILETLFRDHGPFTLEEILARVKKLHSCDLVTMYRSVDTFKKKQLIKRCDFGDGHIRFEIADSGVHHHHIVCTECRSVHKLDHCLLEAIDRGLAKQGFSEVHHSLEFFGICSVCQEKPPPRTPLKSKSKAQTSVARRKPK